MTLYDKLLDEIDDKIMGNTHDLREITIKAKETALLLKQKNDSFAKIDNTSTSYNKKVSRIFSKIVNELFGLDWFEQYNFIHVRNRNNIQYLMMTIESLKSGNINKAIENDLRYVDLCWYGYNFDKATYDIVVDQVIGTSAPFTWGHLENLRQ